MISIAGGPVRGNNYLLDGIPITDSNNRAIIIPTLESVQEVKIQSNTYDAEMARTGGGMFNTLMKSGTNEFHGSLYGHVRKTAMDANTSSVTLQASPSPISQTPLGAAALAAVSGFLMSTTERTKPSSSSGLSTMTMRLPIQPISPCPRSPNVAAISLEQVSA